MSVLLGAIAVYILVFGLDYVLYRVYPTTYSYVSRRTYALFLLSSALLVWLFYSQLPFFTAHLVAEIVPIALIFGILLFFAWAINREKVLVCHLASRTESCLTPGYVVVKGADILFQQLVYALVAFVIYSEIGTQFYSYLLYSFVLLVIHTPVILSTNKSASSTLTFGIAIMSIPLYYIYTEIAHFWPAIYLHALLYMFLWLSFGNWEKTIVTRVTKKI